MIGLHEFLEQGFWVLLLVDLAVLNILFKDVPDEFVCEIQSLIEEDRADKGLENIL